MNLAFLTYKAMEVLLLCLTKTGKLCLSILLKLKCPPLQFLVSITFLSASLPAPMLADTVQQYFFLKYCVNLLLRPVRKPNGEWRLTVDYRDLNEVTPPLSAPVPDVLELQ